MKWILCARQLSWERIAATSATIGLHLATGWFFLGYTGSNRSAVKNREQIVEISFIERATRPARAHLPAIATRPGARQRSAAAATSSSAATATQPGADASVDAQLDLALPEAPGYLERNPLERRVRALPDTPVRMPVTFVERGFGGMMNRMTSASMCRELRAALVASPESAAAIIASMQRIGCGA